jgi:hypothetical protein
MVGMSSSSSTFLDRAFECRFVVSGSFSKGSI